MSEGDSMRLNLSCKKKIPPDDITATCFLGKFNECISVDVSISNLSCWLKNVYTRIRHLIAACDQFISKLGKAVTYFPNVKWKCFVGVEVQNQLFWPRWEMSNKMNFSFRIMFDWPYCQMIWLKSTGLHIIENYIWPLQHLLI